jgi:AcrR family transcriptional regulator
MSQPVNNRRYHSPLRAEQARATRRRVVESASALFVEKGYAATTVVAVARHAGVSVDTVYSAFTNKRGLLKEVMDVNVGGDDAAVEVLAREGPQRMRREPDQREQLRMFAAGMARQLQLVRPLDDVLRSAAATDPEVAALRQDQTVRQRHAAMTQVVGWVRERGPLRQGIDSSHAADVVWTLTSPEVHHLLCGVRGWSSERYEEWLRDALTSTLLPS